MAATSRAPAPALLRAPDGRVFAERAAYVRHVEHLCRLTDAVDQKFVRLPGEVASQSFDVLRLRGCEIVVLDAVAAVSLEDCDNCRIFIGPCAGAVVVRNCRNCSVGLYVTSPPSATGCEAITLLPYNGWYPKQDVVRVCVCVCVHTVDGVPPPGQHMNSHSDRHIIEAGQSRLLLLLSSLLLSSSSLSP